MKTEYSLDLTMRFVLEGSQPSKDHRATMPWRGAIPIAKELLSQTWQEVINQPTPPRKWLVHLHIPFCVTHCIFRSFYWNRFEEDNCAPYTDVLLCEIEMEADNALHQSALIRVVYFDDGIPPASSAQDLARVITVLRDKLSLAPDCETTIEGWVPNFDDVRIGACLDVDANRFSINTQSLNSRIRGKMARTSDGLTATAFMQGLVKQDHAAVVCDLLFGLPGRDARLRGEDLAAVRGIGLDGVDLCTPDLIPDTPLSKAVEIGCTTIPSPAERRDLYLQGCDFMDSVDWHRISNSHWACITQERNLYNLLIKQGTDCLAFGSGAGGSVSGYFWMVERNLNTWYEFVAAGKKLLMMTMCTVECDSQWRYTLQTGTEMVHISLDGLTPHARKLAPLLTQWHHARLARDASTCIHLINEGRFWAGNILQPPDELTQEPNAPCIVIE